MSGHGGARNAALDGLRGWSIIAVLAFHQPFAAFGGGFLGVSVFFTLSGFLITRLLMAELDTSGTVRFSTFYVRRTRRLFPAAAVTIAAVAVVWRIRGLPLKPSETLSSLLYVQNWHLIEVGSSYSQAFGEPSPLRHLWSLAIEEQFYLVLPVVLWTVWRLGGRRRAVLGVIGTATVAGFVTAALHAHESWTYYATTTRMGELLMGSMLAVVAGSGRAHWLTSAWGRPRLRSAVEISAAAGLAIMILLVRLDSDQLFPTAVALNALLTCVLIGACLRGGWIAQRLRGPLAGAFGRISYSLYLLHWPVFLLLSPSATGVRGVPLFLLRMVVTLPLAWTMHRVVEEPIRTGRTLPGIRVAMAVLPCGIAALLFASATTAAAQPGFVDESAIEASYDQLTSLTVPAITTVVPTTTPTDESTPSSGAPSDEQNPGPTTTAASRPSIAGGISTADGPQPTVTSDADRPGEGAATTTPTTTTAPTPPSTEAPRRALQRVLFIGDSTAWTLSLGPKQWGAEREIDVEAFVAVGCAVGGSTAIDYLGQDKDATPECDTWLADLDTLVGTFRPDVVVVAAALADLSDREIDGVRTHVGEPDYDSWLRGKLDALATTLTSTCSAVMWLTTPHLRLDRFEEANGTSDLVEDDPARADRYNELIRDVGGDHPGITVAEFGRYLAEREGGEFADGLRPDGVHLDTSLFPDVSTWLTDGIEAASEANGSHAPVGPGRPPTTCA